MSESLMLDNVISIKFSLLVGSYNERLEFCLGGCRLKQSWYEKKKKKKTSALALLYSAGLEIS